MADCLEDALELSVVSLLQIVEPACEIPIRGNQLAGADEILWLERLSEGTLPVRVRNFSVVDLRPVQKILACTRS